MFSIYHIARIPMSYISLYYAKASQNLRTKDIFFKAIVDENVITFLCNFPVLQDPLMPVL